MIITDIKKEKNHLVRILLDSGEAFLLDKSVCAENGLSKGSLLSDEKIEALSYESDYERAKSRALWYLDRKDYTEKALYTKLLRAGFSKRASAKVMARLTELGMVDDLRFAERFAERCAENNVSKREALHKMLEKGVPYDMAKEVLDSLEADEDEQIRAIIEKKYAYKLSLEGGAEKVYAALVRKGFSYSGIRKALNEFISEIDICEEC